MDDDTQWETVQRRYSGMWIPEDEVLRGGATTLEVLMSWPAVVPLWPDAGTLFGLGRSSTYELAARGEFPVPVLRVGRHLKVSTAQILLVLGVDGLHAIIGVLTPPLVGGVFHSQALKR